MLLCSRPPPSKPIYKLVRYFHKKGFLIKGFNFCYLKYTLIALFVPLPNIIAAFKTLKKRYTLFFSTRIRCSIGGWVKNPHTFLQLCKNPLQRSKQRPKHV